MHGGVGASLTGLVLARPLLWRFNEIHYNKNCMHTLHTLITIRPLQKVLPTLLNRFSVSYLPTEVVLAGTDTCIYFMRGFEIE